MLGDSSPGEGGERQGPRQPQNKRTSVAGRERLEGEEPRSGRSDCIQQGLMNVGWSLNFHASLMGKPWLVGGRQHQDMSDAGKGSASLCVTGGIQGFPIGWLLQSTDNGLCQASGMQVVSGYGVRQNFKALQG